MILEEVAMFFSNQHASCFRKTRSPMKSLQTLTVLFLALSIVLTGLPQALHLQLTAYGAPGDLMVFAEAPSFARLVDIGFQDPSGWFFEAVLYNPTNASIAVTGLRWYYNTSASLRLVDMMRAPFGARDFDTRYFTSLPIAFANQSAILWQYAPGSISINVPAKTILLTWIEAPTRSMDNSLAVAATYSVEAYAGNHWISSPFYSSHGGALNAVSTLFRADFNLATDPNNESQAYPNPNWLFLEDRSIVALKSTRIRLIPVASGEGIGIGIADVNVTLPSFWTCVPGSVKNPLGENVALSYSSFRYHLHWTINHPILVYSTNRSLSQDYIEFNVTAPMIPTVSGFAVNAQIKSINGLTTTESQGIYVAIETPPTADFTVSPSTVKVNQTALFNASLSSDLDGNIVKYAWDFGDGNTALGAIAGHVYTIFGNHTISLTVTDNDGLNDTKTSSILVIDHPTASFTFAPTSPVVGELVDFDSSSSLPNGGSIVSYVWDFGNGHTGVGQTTGTIYTTPGQYVVVLNVTNDAGLWDTETKNVTVKEPPSAYFTYSPGLPLVNQQIVFNASLSNPNVGNITAFYWNFGDGTNGSGSVLTHSYSSFGNYSVTLLVTNSEGVNNSLTLTVRVLCTPICNFTWAPQQICAHKTVTFNASASYDSDGSIVSYRWDFGDGNVTNSTNPILSHIYATFGTYLLNFTVTDNNDLSDSRQAYVTVFEAPTADFSVYPLNLRISQNVTFNATSSTPNGGTILQYKWNFADNTTDEGAIVQHMFATAGTYDVTLTVIDSEGLNATVNQDVNVTANPISVFEYSPAQPSTDQNVTFNASGSIPISGTITEYLWSFGDNSTSTAELTNHTYIASGNYTVTLTVTNSLGLNNTEIRSLRVYASPVANFTVSPDKPSAGFPAVFNATGSYDVDRAISRFRWNFGDGNTTETSEKTISHVYSSAGNCTVTLTVFDNDNYTGSTSKVLMIYSHNVAVSNVALSSTYVKGGKLVNVTVTVKNTGTANETFSVTVYCNSSVLGTQTVYSLLPNTQETLLFTWNTSNLLDGKTYAVTAVAANVTDETNTADNSLSGGYLYVSPGASPFGILGSTSFLLPFGLALGGIITLGAALLFMRRKPADTGTDEPEAAFVDPLDALVGGELPDGFSVMVLGEANAGKSILCQQLTNKYLTQGKPCIYVTYDCFPDEIRDNMRALGWDPIVFEQTGKLAIVDAYSSTAAVTCNEKYWVKQPFTLSELGIAISTAVSGVEPRPKVFLDSTVPLFTRLEPARVVEFLQDRAAQIKGVSGIFFFAVGKGTLQAEHLSRLEEIVDCIIELDLLEKEVDVTRQIRIRKLRGRKYEDRRLEFTVVDQKGMVTSQEVMKKD